MGESGIDEHAIAKFAEDLQREFDKHGPIVIPVEADTSAAVVGFNLHFNTLEKATLTGVFKR